MNDFWRRQVAERCGGVHFDAPATGYSFSKVLAEERELISLNRLGDKSSALLALSIADPRWKMSADAMRAAMDYYELSDDATRYTDNNGIAGTHQRIAQVIAKRYLAAGHIDERWVQYSPGAIKRLLAEYIPSAFFDCNLELVFPTPGYGVIKDKINRRGAKVTDLPLQDSATGWILPIKQISFSPDAEKNFVYINAPHNPTGMDFDEEDWDRLIEWAIDNDVVMIVDEAYVDIRYSENGTSILNIPGWDQCCIVLQSISKGWSATGTRFGWVVANPTVIAVLRNVMDVKDSGGFGPTLAAGLYCLEHPELALATRDEYLSLHRKLFNVLGQAGFDSRMPAGGLCQLTPAPRAVNGRSFETVVDCAKWFRETLRVSLMHYEVQNKWYLRWAVTTPAVKMCELPDENAVMDELGRRLQSVKFSF